MTLNPRRLAAQKSGSLEPHTPDPNEFSFANHNIYSSEPTASASSVITLDDRLQSVLPSSSSLTPNNEYEEEQMGVDESEQMDSRQIYNLPTHISSHYDVLNDGPRSQLPTPVSTPFQERANHPLRALTSDNIPTMRTSNHEMLSSSPVSRPIQSVSQNDSLIIDTDEEESIEEEARILNNRKRSSWDEKGAAVQLVQHGDATDEVIRKSVKDFKFGKTLGVGSYSTVLLATDKSNGNQFAVKVLDKRHIIREKKVKYVNIEKNTLKRLGKRNGIVHMFFTFQDESSLYFVLDFASNGELLNLIKDHGSLNEDAARYYSAQILDAIKFMHNNGVIHRDLKPENILLDDNLKVQITDFGTAKLLEKDENNCYPADTRAKSFVGTAEYVSPELLNEKAIGKGCDIWAFGCILYQMIAGKPPFKATNEYLTFQKIVKLQYAFTAGFPMVIRDLVKRILKLNPKDRLTIKEIENHHFFQGYDFNNPEESIWKPDPPEIGPYKITAKSMLPVPELAGQKTRITIPRRISSQPSTPRSETPSDITAPDKENSQDSSTSLSQPPTASQQVLMRAKAAVAARKQQQQQQQQQSKQGETGKRAASVGNAANAASIALSRQPNDIIKSQNIKKNNGNSNQPPVISESIISPQVVSSSYNPRSTEPSSVTKPQIKRDRSNQLEASPLFLKTDTSSRKTSSGEPAPMTKLDLQFVDYLKDHEERILKMSELNVVLSTVENVEKKFKGKLVDSPLGSHQAKSSSSMLTQVANGSFRGLRNMEQNVNENEKRIITNFPASSDDNSSSGTSTAKSRFKKFFNPGSNDDNIHSKRNRTVLVTTNARLLILDFKQDTDDLELKTEINLNHPVIRVKELIQSSTSINAEGLFVIESYNTAFLFEGQQAKISSWTQIIHTARSIVAEKTAQKRLENDPSGNAGTVLGSDAAKSAANIATIQSPPLNTTKDELLSPTQPPPTNLNESVSVTPDPLKHSGRKTSMFRDMVRPKAALRHSTSQKEQTGNGKLYYGLPMTLVTGGKSTLNSGSRDSNTSDPLIAAASAAALSSQQHQQQSSASGKALHPSQRRSSFNEKTYGHLLSESSPEATAPKKVTGMNSRMLSRSHDRKKKK